MTRKTLCLALFALITLIALPAGAEQAAEPAAPLFAAGGCQSPGMSTPIEVEPPDATYAGPCTVYRRCDDGSTIQCSGQTACSSGPGNGGGYVECDGNRTWCPYDPDCNAGSYCKTSSQCYCFDYLCACVDRRCLCAVES